MDHLHAGRNDSITLRIYTSSFLTLVYTLFLDMVCSLLVSKFPQKQVLAAPLHQDYPISTIVLGQIKNTKQCAYTISMSE